MFCTHFNQQEVVDDWSSHYVGGGGRWNMYLVETLGFLKNSRNDKAETLFELYLNFILIRYMEIK